jgi:SAM-dependent methyltransferase
MGDYRQLNQAWWDQAAGIHANSPLYDLEAFVAGESSLRPFEATELGDVGGLDLVHLQCHIGTDTLSWARLGALVTGYDISEKSLDIARELAGKLEADASFVAGEVYEAPEKLDGKTFDVVYTGIGALNWLPDIVQWAQVVAALLKPGGRLYLVEFHPLLNLINSDEIALDAEWHYFYKSEGSEFTDTYDYSGSGETPIAMTTVEWSHDLGSILSALIYAGLTIEMFHEHGAISYQRWSGLEQVGQTKRWTIPEGQPQLPLEFSLIARKG